MGTVREDLVASIARFYDGRREPAVAEVMKPPRGAEESVSPFTLVMLEGGVTGPCWNLLQTAEERAAYAAMDTDAYRGRGALEVARELLMEQRARRIVGYAACNALSQTLFRSGEIGIDTATDLLDVAGVGPDDRVGLVGYTPPLLHQIISRAGRVTVLEHEGKMAVLDGAQVARSPADLADCQVLLITSTTLLDDSFAEIVRQGRRARFRAIYGPGAAMVPEALFHHGLDAVAGMLITDGPALAERQRNGRPWGDTKRKFVLRRP